MVFVQKSKFFLVVFFGDFRKYCFLIFWIKKNDSETRKKKVLKSAKQRDFPKGIICGFFPNIKLFLIWVFLVYSSQKILFFFDILDRKE